MKKEPIIISNVILYSPITEERTVYFVENIHCMEYVPTIKILLDFNMNISDEERMKFGAIESVDRFAYMINNSTLLNDDGTSYDCKYIPEYIVEDNIQTHNRVIEIYKNSLKCFMKDGELYVSAQFKFLQLRNMIIQFDIDSSIYFKEFQQYKMIAFNNNWKTSYIKEVIHDYSDNIDINIINNILEFFDTSSNEEDYEILKQLL